MMTKATTTTNAITSSNTSQEILKKTTDTKASEVKPPPKDDGNLSQTDGEEMGESITEVTRNKQWQTTRGETAKKLRRTTKSNGPNEWWNWNGRDIGKSIINPITNVNAGHHTWSKMERGVGKRWWYDERGGWTDWYSEMYQQVQDAENQKEVAALVYREQGIFMAVSMALLKACPGTTINAITCEENITSVNS
jgi:hypothetical protein